MFNSIGWGELMILAVIALIIFGPDKLPNLAKDAAKMLRQVRDLAQGARTQLKSELGPEFGDIDLQDLNPKAFVRKHLLDDLDDPFDEADQRELEAGWAGDDAAASESTGDQSPLKTGERAPYDTDAT